MKEGKKKLLLGGRRFVSYSDSCSQTPFTFGFTFSSMARSEAERGRLG